MPLKLRIGTHRGASHTIYLYLPYFSAAFYGCNYGIADRNDHTSVPPQWIYLAACTVQSFCGGPLYSCLRGAGMNEEVGPKPMIERGTSVI